MQFTFPSSHAHEANTESKKREWFESVQVLKSPASTRFRKLFSCRDQAGPRIRARSDLRSGLLLDVHRSNPTTFGACSARKQPRFASM